MKNKKKTLITVICAALAAARSGKKVYLAEATGAFGGAATAAYVPAFAPFDDGVHPEIKRD